VFIGGARASMGMGVESVGVGRLYKRLYERLCERIGSPCPSSLH
jgi:hypothetical protein